MTDQVAILQLMQTKGVGTRTLARTLLKLSEEGRSASELIAASADELMQFGLKPEAARAISTGRDTAEQVAEELERRGVRMLVRGSPEYPSRLSRILANHAPPVLFVVGTPALLERKAVAFCGARDASEDGLRLADEAARRLAARGINVVSGHANGVDLTAHGGALAAGGTTTLVLAEGVLRFQAKPGLAELLGEDNFVVVSEFPPRLPWSIGNAMQRNATVCGLADVVLVVEAGQTGGTFAAGEQALELRQPLFVVEFVRPPASAAGNAFLVRQGAQPLRCETGTELDLTAVYQALERNREPADGRGRKGGTSPVVQRDLFDDPEEAE
jgi:DNA protecting protein DprA